MKKVYLLEVKQHGTSSYLGSIPARELVKVAKRTELDEPQEAQRPVSHKRLDEIAAFVLNEGTISTSIVIGTCDTERLNVHKVNENLDDGLYYMEFPETEAEFEEYKDSFDIMDGQHRLFSFLEDRIKIDETIDYDITFNMYITPSLRLRRLIFKNTNEEQKQVGSNLLLWFRKQLNMLSDKEKQYHDIVELLNTEACSPLKGRIIMGAETVTGGFKAEQIINLLSKCKIKNITGQELTDEKTVMLISEYLSGWEDAVGTKIIDRDRNLAPFSKMAGLRFMILMLPAFYEKAINEKEKFKKEYISKTIKTLASEEGIAPSDIFDTSSNYHNGTNPFGGETPTTMFAEELSGKLRAQALDEFDPLA